MSTQTHVTWKDNVDGTPQITKICSPCRIFYQIILKKLGHLFAQNSLKLQFLKMKDLEIKTDYRHQPNLIYCLIYYYD